MPATLSVHEFLEHARVPYSVVPHKPAFTAQEEAAAVHISGRDWAKVVVCFVDGKAIQAVLPASMTVNLRELADLAGAEEIRLAHEDDLRRLFPDCELGAMPPFGPLYRQPVYADVALALEADIAFNAGTHRDAICMRWSDFARVVRPIVGRFGERE